MAESRRLPPLHPRNVFFLRLGYRAALAGAVVLASLAIGTLGYHGFEGLDWVDAFLNAAMILTGMGPVSELHSTVAKLFAAFYALFSGVVFLTTVAILYAPLLHRFLHRLHLELVDESDEQEDT